MKRLTLKALTLVLVLLGSSPVMAGQIYTVYDFVVIHYNPKQIQSWSKDRAKLVTALQRKMRNGELASITVATWSDQDTMSQSAPADDQLLLAQNRQQGLRRTIAGLLPISEHGKLNFHNMADSDDDLLQTISEHHKVVHKDFEGSKSRQLDLMLPPEVRIINNNAYPSRSVVVIAIEKEMKLRVGGFGSEQL